MDIIVCCHLYSLVWPSDQFYTSSSTFRRVLFSNFVILYLGADHHEIMFQFITTKYKYSPQIMWRAPDFVTNVRTSQHSYLAQGFSRYGTHNTELPCLDTVGIELVIGWAPYGWPYLYGPWDRSSNVRLKEHYTFHAETGPFRRKEWN